MKLLSAAILLCITSPLFSQRNLFDTLKIDATTKIIGRHQQYDKSKTYEEYNFIIEDSAKIAAFIKNLELGKEVENSMEEPSFRLTVVKNFKEIGSWTINPTLKSAMTHDGHTYQFNLDQIANLNKQYPFRYYHEVKVFNTQDEYQQYLATQKKNENFLFDYSPRFAYEGSFEIEFPKNATFPHPKGISEYLTPYIEKSVKKGQYSISYALNEKNMNNRNQYTMTIQGPKKLFEQLKPDNIKTGNWKPNVESAYFFYKK